MRKAANHLEDAGKVVAERIHRSKWWDLPEQSSFGEAGSDAGFHFFIITIEEKRREGGNR